MARRNEKSGALCRDMKDTPSVVCSKIACRLLRIYQTEALTLRTVTEEVYQKEMVNQVITQQVQHQLVLLLCRR